jgi:hypothetical protein
MQYASEPGRGIGRSAPRKLDTQKQSARTVSDASAVFPC